MATLGWDATDTATYPVVDRVARTLYSANYSALETYQQGVVNDAGLMALEVLKGFGAYFPDALVDNPAPGTWVTWLWAEAILFANVNAPGDRADDVRRARDEAREAALQTYSFDTSVNNTAGSLTLLEIRKFVAVNLARRGVLPPIQMVDMAARWALNHIWNRKNWIFRRRPVTLTIATDETVTVSDSVSMDAANTRVLWYSDSAGPGLCISAVDADKMAALKATYTDTGRPEYFRVHQEDQAWVWEFNPTPDQSYTVRTEALIVGPPAITDETSTTPFAQYPAEFAPIILDLVLARVMQRMGQRDGNQMFDDAMEQVDMLAPRYESFGRPTSGGSVRDVYQDPAFIVDSNGFSTFN